MGKPSCYTKPRLRASGGCLIDANCTHNDECESGYCEMSGPGTWEGAQNGICRPFKPSSTGKSQVGEWCTEDNHCLSNHCDIKGRSGCASHRAGSITKKPSCYTRSELRALGGCGVSTMCTNDDECVSGYCEVDGPGVWSGSGGGICRPFRLTESGDNDLGEWCTSDSHCRSQKCDVTNRSGCKSAPKKDTCDVSDDRSCPFSASCVKNIDCEHNSYCTNGYCRYQTSKKYGEDCTRNDECTSGNCINKKCDNRSLTCTKPDPKSCSAATTCTSSKQCPVESSCDTAQGVCRLNDNMHDRREGAYCTNDVQCAKSLCRNSACTLRRQSCPHPNSRDCGWSDHGCSTDADCIDNSFCEIRSGEPNTCRLKPCQKNRAMNNYCTSDDQCGHTSVCRDKRCVSMGKPCTEPNSSSCDWSSHGCTTDADCAPGLVCQKTSNQSSVCRHSSTTQNRAVGDYCTDNEQCGADATCRDSKCTQQKQSCSRSDSRDCDWTTHGCSTSEECESDSFCDHQSGQPSVCRPNDSVVNRPNGDFCTDDRQCVIGNICRSGRCISPSNACTIPDKSLCDHAASRCETDSDCLHDNYCDVSAGPPYLCRLAATVTNRDTGEYCTSNSQCVSDRCTDGACVIGAPTCTDPTNCSASVCTVTQDCAKNNECIDRVCRTTANGRADGEYCSSSTQCGPDSKCVANACIPKSRACTDAVSCQNNLHGCDTDADCVTGSFCDKSTPLRPYCRVNSDMGNRVGGQYCTDSFQCEGASICQDHNCTTPYVSGESCNSDTVCASGACRLWDDTKRCCPLSDNTSTHYSMANTLNNCGNLNPGDACNSSSQCTTKNCVQKKCSDQPPEETIDPFKWITDILSDKSKTMISAVVVVALAVVIFMGAVAGRSIPKARRSRYY